MMLDRVPLFGSRLQSVLSSLPPMSVNGPWIAGGAPRRAMVGDETECDIDVYFKDAKQMADFSSCLAKDGFEVINVNHYYVTYKKGDQEVQCMNFRFYDHADEVIDTFDFTICMFVYDGNEVRRGEKSLADLYAKKLCIHKITFPVSTLHRLLKYYEQGFVADDATQVMIAEAVIEEQREVTGLLRYVNQEINGGNYGK